MAKPTREQIDNPHPTRKAILRGNKNDRQYLHELVKSINHLGYEFGSVSNIISGELEDWGYLVSLPDLFYLVDRIVESIGMPQKSLNIPNQGTLFVEEEV